MKVVLDTARQRLVERYSLARLQHVPCRSIAYLLVYG